MTTLTKKGPPRGRRPFSGLCYGYKKYNSPEARSQSTPPPAAPALPEWMTRRLLEIARRYQSFLSLDAPDATPVPLGKCLATATWAAFVWLRSQAELNPEVARLLPESIAAALSNNSVLSLTPLEQAVITIAENDQQKNYLLRRQDREAALRLWFGSIAELLQGARDDQ